MIPQVPNSQHDTHRPLAFAPTYKLRKPPGRANAPNYKENRRPAWCDRVLFKSVLDVACPRYESIDCALSDHYPVIADLQWDWDSLAVENWESNPAHGAGGVV